MNASADETRTVLVAGTLGLGVGLTAALFSLDDRVESFAEVAGVSAAAIAGAAAGVALTLLALRREALAATMIAIYAGSALIAVAGTRERSEYESSIILLLVGVGAALVVVYGLLARRLLRPTGWKIRAPLALFALAGAASVATMLAVTVPLVVISALTWRATVNDE